MVSIRMVSEMPSMVLTVWESISPTLDGANLIRGNKFFSTISLLQLQTPSVFRRCNYAKIKVRLLFGFVIEKLIDTNNYQERLNKFPLTMCLLVENQIVKSIHVQRGDSGYQPSSYISGRIEGSIHKNITEVSKSHPQAIFGDFQHSFF